MGVPWSHITAEEAKLNRHYNLKKVVCFNCGDDAPLIKKDEEYFCKDCKEWIDSMEREPIKKKER